MGSELLRESALLFGRVANSRAGSIHGEGKRNNALPLKPSAQPPHNHSAHLLLSRQPSPVSVGGGVTGRLSPWPRAGPLTLLQGRQDLKTAILIPHKGKSPYLFRSVFTLIMRDANTSWEGRAPWAG